MTAQNPPGLRPLAGKDPTILILGSFPSIISLEKGEYYANPRNSFWRIMDVLFDVDSNLPYKKRVEALMERGIVLWDVISGCLREGSSDSSIRDVIPNDITGFLRQNPTIKCIVLNGSAGAGMWFKRIFGELTEYPDIAVLTLLSTSPANAAYSFDEKVSRWRKIVEFAKK